MNRINVAVGLMIAFVVGVGVGGLLDNRPERDGGRDELLPISLAPEPPWLPEDTFRVLSESFPNAFPADAQLLAGQAFEREQIQVMISTERSYLEAKGMCRKSLPRYWVEVGIDRDSVAFVSPLRGSKQTTVLIRNLPTVRYEISTEGAVHVKASKLARLDGTTVAKDDLGKYLIRLQATR